MRYYEHLDYLVAAINYLGRSGPWARTPTFLASELGLDAGRLQSVFDGFPGVFRKSRKISKHKDRKEHYYSLQARYAQRPDYGKTEEGTEIDPLSPAEIDSILDFVLRAANFERENRRALVANSIAVGAAVISAGAAIVVAVLSQQ